MEKNSNKAVLLDMVLPYDLALLAKEYGYNKPGFAYFNHKGKLYTFDPTGINGYWNSNKYVHDNRNIFISKSKSIKTMAIAPTWDSFFNWVREAFNIYIDTEVISSPVEIISISYSLKSFIFEPVDIGEFFNNKEANIACANKIFNFLKTNKL